MSMKFKRSRRRRNPAMSKKTKTYLLWGGLAVGGFLLYKRFGAKAAAPAARVPTDAGPAEELSGTPSRYKLVKRGSDAACYDLETRTRVSNDLCTAEMLQGVGGIFG